jgi:hypothetical protein
VVQATESQDTAAKVVHGHVLRRHLRVSLSIVEHEKVAESR